MNLGVFLHQASREISLKQLLRKSFCLVCSAGLGCSAGSEERLKNSGLGCRVLGEGAVGTVRGAPGHSLMFDGGSLALSPE